MNESDEEDGDSSGGGGSRPAGKLWGKVIVAVGTVIGVAIVYVVQHWPSPTPAEGTIRITKAIWCDRFAAKAISVEGAVRKWNDDCAHAKNDCAITVSNADLAKMAGGWCWTEHQGVRIQYTCTRDGADYPQDDQVTGADEDNVRVTLRCRFSK